MEEHSMQNNTYCCKEMFRQIENGLIVYDGRYDEYCILLKSEEGIDFMQKVDFCPWSGDRLPASQRDKWFDELEAMGIDPLNDSIPILYQSAEWRKN